MSASCKARCSASGGERRARRVEVVQESLAPTYSRAALPQLVPALPAPVATLLGSYMYQGRHWNGTGKVTSLGPSLLPSLSEENNMEPAGIVRPSTKVFISRMLVHLADRPGCRYEERKEPASPGPGKYNVAGLSRTGKDTSPAPTLSGRNREPEPFNTPAPGHYRPERSDKVLNTPPSYTIAGRPRETEQFRTPAPGQYRPERSDKVLCTAPSYTFGNRPKDSESFMTPAPGTYSPEKSDKVLNTTPSYSLSGRHKPPEPFNTPAPGHYCPERSDKVLNTTPSYTISGRPKEPEPFKTPAPGQYCPEKSDKVLNQTPSYSISGRHKESESFKTPAPGQYCPERSDKVLNTTPSYSFGLKGREVKPDETPGPGAHSPEKHFWAILNGVPRYTFGIKHSPYTIFVKDMYDTYGKVKRHLFEVLFKYLSEMTVQQPGVLVAVFQQMSTSTQSSISTTEKALLEKGPAYTFGIRHSPYAGHTKEKIFQGLISTLQLVEKLDRYPLRNKRKIDSVEPEETSMNVKKEGTQVSNYVVQHLPRNPSIFSGEDGEDLQKWLKGYARVAKYNHWDETLCLTKVYFYLSGTALKWFENNEESIQTWKEFTSQLENVFGKKENSKLQEEKKLKTRAQLKGESTECYIQDVLCLCKEVDPQMSEEDKISHLMKGIAEELYQALLPRDVQSTEQFITECRRVEALRCRRVTPTRYERLPNVASLCDQDDGEDLSSMIKQIVCEEEEIGRTLAPISMPRRSPPQKEKPRQFLNTRYEAETIRPHPEPRYPKQGGRRDTNDWRTTEGRPICFYCGRPGHVVRYCRDRKRHNEERRNEYFQRKQDAMVSYNSRAESQDHNDESSRKTFTRYRSPTSYRGRNRQHFSPARRSSWTPRN
ncbi:hypothetical protein LAZ67_5001662 [Cordylochernes scorpioides]|uniref:CCHC-type domain-containing protein n=1 Tax=Cordylochernes scorpioides TaxID=51811 RepID=A0ABY6KFS4_9ARAC|nr:hypothetical protein LAZ67_5001662 [Cordylochernes scorpioides]